MLFRKIQKYIENELAECLLKNELIPNQKVKMVLVNNKVTVK